MEFVDLTKPQEAQNLAQAEPVSKPKEKKQMSVEQAILYFRKLLSDSSKTHAKLMSSCYRLADKEYEKEPQLPNQAVDAFIAHDESLDAIWDFFVAVNAVSPLDEEDEGEEEEEEGEEGEEEEEEGEEVIGGGDFEPPAVETPAQPTAEQI